jgi:hypothetical protein
MMVVKPMVTVVVAEGHDRERKRRENSLQKKNWRKRGADFFQFLHPIFFMLRP